MSKWQKIVKVIPICILFFIFAGLIACYIAFISIFNNQNDKLFGGSFFSFNNQATKSHPSQPEPKLNHWWLNRHEHYVQKTLDSNGTIPILFIGDSLMEGWNGNGHIIFQHKYAPLGVVDYGISADRTEHLLWRLQNGEIDSLTPKLVVIMIGTNNLGQPHTNEDIAEGIEAIVAYLRTKTPNSKILLLSILPRNGEEVFTRVIEINRIIAKLHDGESVFYLDMFPDFASTTSFGVQKELFYDGVHLTFEGYQKWSEVMEPLFNQLAYDY